MRRSPISKAILTGAFSFAACFSGWTRRRTFSTSAAFLSVGVAGYAWYFAPQIQNLSPEIFGNLFARPWLTLHAGGAGTARA